MELKEVIENLEKRFNYRINAKKHGMPKFTLKRESATLTREEWEVVKQHLELIGEAKNA